ncbi:MAG: ROK family protein [Bdellovibrionales bacterium]|nr:ROK family protein [Bdellovibrionales bacterium]
MKIGIDIGGTKIEACLISNEKGGSPSVLNHPELGDLCVLGRHRVPTERDRGYTHIVSNIAKCVLELLSETHQEMSSIEFIGMGLPGSVNPKNGIMYRGNTLVLEGQPLVKDLRTALNFSGQMQTENDANLFAYAETICGAGLAHEKKSGLNRNQMVGVGVIIGTGCGGGIVINGKMLKGRNGSAGEIGHLELHENGHSCFCGQMGCAEQYVSGPAVEAAYEARRNSKNREILSTSQIFKAAEEGNPVAMATLNQYKRDLGKLISKVNDFLNPDFIVLGGGVSRQPSIYNGLEAEIEHFSFVKGYVPQIYQHQLGDSAGVIGAALMGYESK